MLREALAIRLTKLGADHLATAKTSSDLDSVLLDRPAYAEAEPLLIRAHAVRSKQLGAAHAQTRAAADALVKLYSSSGKPAEAAKFSAVQK